MNTELYEHLKNYMNDFLDDACEQDYWIDAIVHPELSKHMADAAFAVLIALEAAQKYREKEGP